MPIIIEHPFFFQCSVLDCRITGHLCHTALTERSCRVKEELFCKASIAKCMYFLTSGKLFYVKRREQLNQHLRGEHVYAVGSPSFSLKNCGWACEAVLWVQWLHLGWLTSNTVCELIQVDAEKARMSLAKGHH